MLKRTVRGTIVWALVLRRTDVWAESENIHGSCLLRWTSIWSLTLMSVLFMSLVMSVFPLVCLRCISRSWSDLLYAMFSTYIFFHRFFVFLCCCQGGNMLSLSTRYFWLEGGVSVLCFPDYDGHIQYENAK